jgi:hypothetical protein
MSYTRVSVLKVNSNAGRPLSFRDRVVLFAWDDVETVPARDASGILVAGDIVMAAGKTALEMYVTPKSLKVFDTSEGDPDKKGYIQHLEYEHPGDELAYAEFAENSINVNFGAIVQRCDGTNARLLGTPCCPLQFQHEGQNDSEAVTNMVKFESLLRGPKIAHYTGTIPVLDSDGSGSGA